MRLLKRHLTGWASLALLVAPASALIGAAFSVNWPDVSDLNRAIFVFFGVLPLVNAVLDVVSYGTTLITARMGMARVWHPFLWGLIDAVLAVFYLFVLGAVLVSVIAALNHVTGVEFFSLGQILAEIGDVKTYWWLWLMAFSTLIPTFVHLCIACFSLQPCAGRRYRTRLIYWIENHENTVYGPLASLGLAGLWAVSIVVPLGVLGLLGWGVYVAGADQFLGAYIQWLTDLVVWIEGR